MQMYRVRKTNTGYAAEKKKCGKAMCTKRRKKKKAKETQVSEAVRLMTRR